MSNQTPDKTGTQKSDDPVSIEPGEREPVVNTEEQNMPVNPGDADYKETSAATGTMKEGNDNTQDSKPDNDSESDTPRRSDADEGPKKRPNL